VPAAGERGSERADRLQGTSLIRTFDGLETENAALRAQSSQCHRALQAIYASKVWKTVQVYRALRGDAVERAFGEAFVAELRDEAAQNSWEARVEVVLGALRRATA